MNAFQKDMPSKDFTQQQKQQKAAESMLHILPKQTSCKILELLHPGSFVIFKNQPNDLPPFQLISCSGGRCLVRQQAWGKYIQWEVEHHRLKSA